MPTPAEAVSSAVRAAFPRSRTKSYTAQNGTPISPALAENTIRKKLVIENRPSNAKAVYFAGRSEEANPSDGIEITPGSTYFDDQNAWRGEVWIQAASGSTGENIRLREEWEE